MAPLPPLPSYLDINALHRTKASAERLVRKLAQTTKNGVRSPPVVVEALALSLPPPVFSRLTALGVEETLAHRISGALSDSVARLKHSCEAAFEGHRQTLQTTIHPVQTSRPSSWIPSNFAALYAKLVQNWVSYLLNELAPRILRAQALRRRERSITPGIGAERKRPFNPAAVPRLEQYFDRNAFPSRLDKCELAAACDMEYRQIHVWFQNRRSRFRKEGKSLNKPDQAAVMFPELETSIMDALLPPEMGSANQSEPNLDLAEEPQPRANHAGFNFAAPSHAFPSPYPPLCSCNPFPIAPEDRIFLTPWPRTTQSASPRCQLVMISEQVMTSAEVAGLASSFAKLSLSDDDGPTDESALHATLGFVTACPRAPLRALIRVNRRTPQSFDIPSSPDRISTLSRQSPHRRPIPSYPNWASAMSVCGNHRQRSSTPACSTTPGSRAVKRTLPRRVPRNPPAQRPHPSLSALQASNTPSSRSSSRSSSIADSDSESLLVTPPLLPSDLPPDTRNKLDGNSVGYLSQIPDVFDNHNVSPIYFYPTVTQLSNLGDCSIYPSTLSLI